MICLSRCLPSFVIILAAYLAIIVVVVIIDPSLITVNAFQCGVRHQQSHVGVVGSRKFHRHHYYATKGGSALEEEDIPGDSPTTYAGHNNNNINKNESGGGEGEGYRRPNKATNGNIGISNINSNINSNDVALLWANSLEPRISLHAVSRDWIAQNNAKKDKRKAEGTGTASTSLSHCDETKQKPAASVRIVKKREIIAASHRDETETVHTTTTTTTTTLREESSSPSSSSSINSSATQQYLQYMI